MQYRRPSIARQKAIQDAAMARIKSTKHAPYAEWHFVDGRHGLARLVPDTKKHEARLMTTLIIVGLALCFGLMLGVFATN